MTIQFRIMHFFVSGQLESKILELIFVETEDKLKCHLNSEKMKRSSFGV